MFASVLKVALFLIYMQYAVQAIVFTESVYHVTLNRATKTRRLSVVRVQLDDLESSGDVRYWIEDDSIGFDKISIDSRTGEIKFDPTLHPISLSVTVHATLQSGFNQSDAHAAVRVHVVCYIGSHVWDSTRRLSHMNMMSPLELCHFELRAAEIYSDGETTNDQSTYQSLQLVYRIQLQNFGCITQTRLICVSEEGIRLENADWGEIGSGMDCPTDVSRKILVAKNRDQLEVYLGDLCAVGGQNSWIAISINVTKTGKQTRSSLQCTISTGKTTIENSRLWYNTSADNDGSVRQKRDAQGIHMSVTNFTGNLRMNRAESTTIKIFIPPIRTIHESSLSVTCPKSLNAGKPQCTVKVVRLTNEMFVNFKASVQNFTEFNAVQQNRVRINFMEITFADGKKDQSLLEIIMEIEVRLTHCAEVQTNSSVDIQIEGTFDGNQMNETLSVGILKEQRPITDLRLVMQTDTLDVYPGDKVAINAILKNTETSQGECRSVVLVLHSSAWVSDVYLTDANKKTKLNKTDIRRMDIMTGELFADDSWNVTVNVQFNQTFDFSETSRLAILSLTLTALCELEHPIDGHEQALTYRLRNVVLHSARDQFTDLVDHKSDKVGDCQVTTWSSAYPISHWLSTAYVTDELLTRLPFDWRHWTILLGTMSDLHYIRIDIKRMEVQAFAGSISFTTDGLAFSDIGEEKFFADHGDTFTCVFRWPIQARGIRIVPKRDVIRQNISPASIRLYGIKHERDNYQFDPCGIPFKFEPRAPRLPKSLLVFNRSYIYAKNALIVCQPVPGMGTFLQAKMTCAGAFEENPQMWFDIGPMVSQVLTYQHVDKLLFGLGPERSSLVITTSLQKPWIGVTFGGYRNYITDKHHINATYLPWDESNTFNKNLTGDMCATFSVGNWSCEYIMCLTRISRYILIVF
ncbi:hypothetical protein D915_010387 [Fasciola hepatica]|uniref:F5/8 type C domain-containing protein n=1 Tax=Fasciola hepatica TaxID=6192 RepID=A0A4E0RAC9_FASHE|nr:hypothetical protein D915_010387 [Fasciola hepatica]